MFSKTLFVVLLVSFVSDFSYGQRDKKFFRKDYRFLDASESFYKIHTLHKTWFDAKRVCALEGASLFYPETDDEAQDVLQFWNATQPFSWVYVGISDLIVKGVFETIHGHPVTDVYNNWGPGEPNDANGEEDCVILRRNGFLNDDSCHQKYPFICKKSLPSLEWNTNCNIPNLDEQRDRRFFRKDYTYLEAFESFYKIHTIPLTWLGAKKQCTLEGGILWHPENDDEAHVLISFWNSTKPKIKWMYVGLSDLLVEGVFVTVDDKPITEVYSTWEINEPNNAGGEEDCVHMDYHGNMNDVDCDKILPFICKKSLDTLQWNTQCNIPNLDYSFSKDTGKCYKLHTTPLTWPEASARCEAEHTSLAVISSHREAFYLEKLTESARKPEHVENFQRGIYHLGFHNRLKEGWHTIKGAQLNVEDDLWFENYRPEGRDQCGSMFYTGRLINTDCEMKSFFICEHQPTESTFIPVSISANRAANPVVPYFGFGAE